MSPRPFPLRVVGPTAVLCLFSTPSFALDVQDVTDEASRADLARITRAVSASRVTLETFDLPGFAADRFQVDSILEGREVTLHFHKQSHRADDFRVFLADETGVYDEVPAPPVRTYRLVHADGVEAEPGTLRGWASLYEGRLDAGLTWTEGIERSFEITPVDSVTSSADAVVHAVVNRRFKLGLPGTCGTTGEAVPTPFGSAGGTRAPGPSTTVGAVAALLDDCYVQSFGGGLGAQISAALVDAEAIHAAENTAYGVSTIDIQHSIAGFVVETNVPTNCFTRQRNPQQQLNDFGANWNTNYANLFPGIGLTHEFTGRPWIQAPNQNVIGIAWLGGWCVGNRMFATNNITSMFGVNNRAALVAHERGHNWNATHCSASGQNPCTFNTPNCDIMEACLISNGQVGTFGTQATNQINAFKVTRNCLFSGSLTSRTFFEKFTSGTINPQRWESAVRATVVPSPLDATNPVVALSNPTTATVPQSAVLKTVPLSFLPAIPFMTDMEIEFDLFTSTPRLNSMLTVEYLDRDGNWTALPYLRTTSLASSVVTTPYEVIVPWDELHYDEFRLRFRAENLDPGDTLHIDNIWVKDRPHASTTINGGTFMAVGDLNADGQDDLVLGHPNLAGFKGTVGVHLSGNRTASASFSGTLTFEGLGHELAVLGDLNGDGFPELACGGPGLSTAPQNGVVRVFSGAGFAQTPPAFVPLFGGAISGANTEEFGTAIAAMGDVDGDGNLDFAVGAPAALNGQSVRTGAVYIHSGTNGARIAAGTVFGDALDHRFGGSIDTVERADTQSEPDLVVGMRYDTRLGQKPAYVKVFSGRIVSGALPQIKRIDAAAVIPSLAGTVGDPQFGWKVSGIGDFDNDGWSDIAIGIVGTRFGFTNGPIQAGGHVLVRSASNFGSTNTLLRGEPYAGYFGISIEPAGDMNEDGRDDFIVGAGYLDRFVTAGGAFYVMVGPNGTLPNGSIPVERYYRVEYGMSAWGALGYNVAAGDFDGDNLVDLVASTNRACSSTSCPNTTTIYSGYTHSPTFIPVARGSSDVPNVPVPTLRGIRNNFSGGATLDLRDFPPGASPQLLIGNTITKAYSFLGADFLVVPTAALPMVPDGNGRFTVSYVPPVGGGLTYHQYAVIVGGRVVTSNIVERTY